MYKMCGIIGSNAQVSKRERDMVMKNSELSFRVRTLEETISQLRKDKSKLVMTN